VPTGNDYNQCRPWTPALEPNQWRESNELHFIRGLPNLLTQLERCRSIRW
jgi:hypothetical protein